MCQILFAYTRFDTRFFCVDATAITFRGAPPEDELSDLVWMELQEARNLDLPPHRFRVRAAHRVDHCRFAIERNENVAAQRVPFPVAGEPGHAGTEAPVAGAARDHHGIEPVLAQVEGVAEVRVTGGDMREVRVDVDLDTGRVTVHGEADDAAVRAAIEEAGYAAR